MIQNTILAYTFGDVHTAGIVNFLSIANDLGYNSKPFLAIDNLEMLLKKVYEIDPTILALSYRRTPKTGQNYVDQTVARLKEHNLFGEHNNLRILFGGLPETCERVSNRHPEISVFPQSGNPERDVLSLAIILGLEQEEAEEYAKMKIAETGDNLVLSQIADDLISSENYWNHKRLGETSDEAKKDLLVRMKEDKQNGLMTLRTHFGIPDPYSPEKTIEGVKKIADKSLIGVVSLGSSDRTQRAEFFGQPEVWKDGKDDGGVIIRDINDMIALYQATRRGNFPAIKPYCGTDNMIMFNSAALEHLHIDEAFQAIPLPGEWFGELDGRGPLDPIESIIAHQELASFLTKKGVPIEANNPHHYALRYGHDTLTVAAHGITAANANHLGIKDYIIQLMFNTPPISSWGDLARMSASLDLAREIRRNRPIHVETRAGLMYFSPDQEVAKRQLATTTLLQMYLDPKMIHVVNYCEADHAATVDDVEESALITLQAVSYFRDNKNELPDLFNNPKVVQRKNVLINEARQLMTAIGRLGGYQGEDIISDSMSEKYLSNPQVIAEALDIGLLAAPAITYEKYPNASNIFTAVIDGALYAVDPTNFRIIPEEERISNLINK